MGPVTHYPLVEAAMEDMRHILPIAKAALRKPRDENPEAYDTAAAVVAYIERGGMEAAFRRMAKPDGSLDFTFTPAEAARLMDRARVTMDYAGAVE